MLYFGIICAVIATASAGYASSSSDGAGLYNSNAYEGANYGSKYPYSNQYTGYAGGSAGGYPFVPAAPFASPYDFQNAYQQYYNQLSALNAKHLTTTYAGEGASVQARARLGPKRYKSKKIDELYNQQLAQQASILQSIRNQAYGAGGYGGVGYGGAGFGTESRFGGADSGFGGASAGFGGASAGFGGAGAYGGQTGSYGGVGPSGSYGGTYGGNPREGLRGSPARGDYSPNYASAGGSVGNGYQQQYANIYPENIASPNLDSRFGGDDSPIGVTHSQGQPGFVGVSSFSSSSDVNGQRHREAATSVNNNGKVTTYQARS